MPAQASQDVTVTKATQHRAEDGGHHVCGAGGHWVHTTADIEGTWSRGHTAGQHSQERPSPQSLPVVLCPLATLAGSSHSHLFSQQPPSTNPSNQARPLSASPTCWQPCS